jgi:hypothetical protein
MKLVVAFWFVVLGSLAACGGRPTPINASQQELDQRHCTSNSDCASGLCSSGRCG